MERLSRHRLFGALALLVAWTALLTFLSSIWTHRQFEVPPAWDHALYLSMSLRFHRSFEEGGGAGLMRQVLSEPSPVAPLFPLTTVPLYRALGESRETAQLTLAPYLFLLLVGTVLLSARLDAKPSIALLSAFSLSTFTGVVNFSREYMMDLPAAAMATLGLAALSRRGPGLLAGFVAGVTLLTKVLAGVFFVGPLAYSLFSGDRRKLAFFAAACLATAGVWYAFRAADIFRYVAYYGFGEGSIPFRSSSHPGYYLRILITQGTGWLPFAVVALSGILTWRQGRPDAFLLVWLASGYALLAILPNKGGERYVLALLPPLAVLGARAISRVEAPAVRMSLVVLTVAAGAINFAGITWPSRLSSWTHHHLHPFPHAMPLDARELRGWPTADVLRALGGLRKTSVSSSALESFVERSNRLDDAAFVEAAYREWLGRKPDPAGRKAYLGSLAKGSRMQVVESLVRSEELRMRPLRVLVVPDHRVFNAATLQYLAESERRPLRFQRATEDGIEEADAAILKDGGPQGPWPESATPPAVSTAIEDKASDRASFPCPDGSRIVVLALRRGPPGG
jgi:hypothetical protein